MTDKEELEKAHNKGWEAGRDFKYKHDEERRQRSYQIGYTHGVESLNRSNSTPLNWQPIETAPKDGTAVFVFDGDSHDIFEAVWDSTFRNWHSDRSMHPIDEATHWMPLPERPKETKEIE